jgi:hypothetical protein
MYFKDFPTFFYEYTINGEKSLTTVKDITRNIRFRRDILSNITVFDEYDIQEGETPEIIAEKLYGNPEYHWIIMLANDRYDYISDFPLSQAELEQFVYQKYGNYTDDMDSDVREAENALAKFSIHHFETSDGTVVFDESQFPEISFENRFFLEDGSGNITDESDRQLVTENSIEDPPQIIDSFVKYPVTNIDYEIRINEQKRRIKIIPQYLLNKILQDFKDIL